MVLSDYFADDAISEAKWRVGSLTAGESFTDRQIEVVEEGGQLRVSPRTGVTGRAYSGLITNKAWDMTGAHARVEVLQATQATANTIFAIGTDSDNWYGFVVESGKLFMQSKVSGRKNSTDVPYSLGRHKHWRIRHEEALNQILWETSPNGQNWTVQRRLAASLPLTEMYLHMGAGTYRSEIDPGAALFDNFRFVIHTEQ